MRALASTLFKWLLVAVGAISMLDGLLPTSQQSLRIDGHQSQSDSQSLDTNYKLMMIGGSTDHCGVGYEAYKTLRDGDRVEVITSAIFKQCARISRDEQLVHVRKYWRLFSLLAGGLLIGGAMGWLKHTGDDA